MADRNRADGYEDHGCCDTSDDPMVGPGEPGARSRDAVAWIPPGAASGDVHEPPRHTKPPAPGRGRPAVPATPLAPNRKGRIRTRKNWKTGPQETRCFVRGREPETSPLAGEREDRKKRRAAFLSAALIAGFVSVLVCCSIGAVRTATSTRHPSYCGEEGTNHHCGNDTQPGITTEAATGNDRLSKLVATKRSKHPLVQTKINTTATNNSSTIDASPDEHGSKNTTHYLPWSSYSPGPLPAWASSLSLILPDLGRGDRQQTKDDEEVVPLIDHLRRRLYGSRDSPSSSSSSTSSSSSSSSSSSFSPVTGKTNDPQLVIAGKMTVDDALCNIAQYNLRTKKWSLTERIQLSLYNSYSGGEVYSLLANHTNTAEAASINPTNSIVPANSHSKTKNKIRTKSSDNEGSGELIVVGAFDTTYRNSQVTYCSVGKWDGSELSKVGEGLCNSALSKGMKITTAAMAGPQDVYAAGSFQTQVWNGDRHEFVKIYNIAHYNAAGEGGPVWLPLNVGQITCSWCTVTVLALAWDAKRQQLHVAGKFNAIDGRNVPAGLAIYDLKSGRLVAHPGGGLAMKNLTEDGVGTALQLDEEKGVLYVMGSFERLTATAEVCIGLAAYDINSNRWTCLANSAHTVQPTGGGNMILTPYGLMVAGKTSGKETTWEDESRPYTIALLHTTLKTHQVDNHTDTVSASSHEKSHEKVTKSSGKTFMSPVSSLILSTANKSSFEETHGIRNANNKSDSARSQPKNVSYHEFEWSWLPGFHGNDEPLHALANGFGDHEGAVFIAGDNLVAKWSYQERPVTKSSSSSHDHSHRSRMLLPDTSTDDMEWTAVTENLSTSHVRGAIMAISQMQLTPDPEPEDTSRHEPEPISNINVTILITLAVGCLIGLLGAVMCNGQLRSKIFPCLGFDFSRREEGFPLDTLQIGHTNITDAYQRAMRTRYVEQPHMLTIINPQEIFLQRIIGEGTFGRVWSARWKSSSVAVKEFVFAQAAVIGRSSMQQQIVEEIIGEAGMMSILRHPNVLQLFGCSLTAQAIWIVSELCSLGSLRQVLDDRERILSDDLKVNLALQVAEGMSYLHNQDPAIIHRDLKSHNIFVHETFIDTEQAGDSSINGPSGDGQINQFTKWIRPQKMQTHTTLVAKIGDWGSARATWSGSRTMTHGVGTACWLAPEVIKHARCSKYSDVYGYGIILWEMSTREEVYQGLESTQIIAKVANEGLRPPVPNNCSWGDVMAKSWAEHPADRYSFNEIVTELNRISKDIDDDDNGSKENDAFVGEKRQLQEQDLEENAEETTMLITIDESTKSGYINQKNGRKRNLLSTILRQQKGVG